MKSFENHQIGNLKRFEDGKMFRVISLAGKTGRIAISNEAAKNSLALEIDFPDTSMIHKIITRVRKMFDLESDPVVIANVLERDSAIGKLLRANPELSKIPYGKTVSYKQVAPKIGTNGVRAVGTANGRNPLSIIVPCHRVIASDGTLGGYAGGLSIKETLLALERNESR